MKKILMLTGMIFLLTSCNFHEQIFLKTSSDCPKICGNDVWNGTVRINVTNFQCLCNKKEKK